MKATMIARASDKLMSIGRIFFAIGLIAWGLQHLVSGDFVTRVVPSWPGWMPARTFWAYLVGAALIVVGVTIILHIKARATALTFGVLAFMSFLLLHLPLAFKDVLWGGSWTSAGKALVMCGGAMCVAVSLTDAELDTPSKLVASPRVRQGLVIWGRLCLGAFMILCGIQHFMYVPFVASLVPRWIPGAVFWTYFAGVALIAGGVGIVVPQVTRVAAMLSGAMIFSWVFLVHVPLALREPHNPGQVAAVFEALAFSGVAFLLAGLADRGEGFMGQKSSVPR
jgi:uncharacterized membrane protein YphA (DoxX/SURF4 family)